MMAGRSKANMAKIIIDEREVECRDGVPVLQAALEAGWDVPHYCYHPGLSVVASCRLCLMEMKMPHPKTKELGWAPKLFPSCQTPVKDGMEVRFNSDGVIANQKSCMEYFLLNHPLDCPVCDKAGECHLQDYSYKFGNAESRMHDQKMVNPKKDIGPKTLLYSDRCVLCSRCVRFADEISGTGELCVTNRGGRAEIDVFPGEPLDNALQGNVVDICPVGALLDKDFLFEQRVWFLKGRDSICAGCSTGCAIRVDSNKNVVHRLKPRFNPGVNDWWMCDEGRFGFKYVHDPKRIAKPRLRRGMESESPAWEHIPEIVRYRFERHVSLRGGASVGVLLSPMMSNEEAWLLATFIRSIAPEATLAMGHVPVDGEDAKFPVAFGEGNGSNGNGAAEPKFTIRNEKCPNRRGIEMLIEKLGGASATFEEFSRKYADGELSAAWVVGGYPREWPSKDLGKAVTKCELLVAQDLFENEVTAEAEIVLPSLAWVERDGSFTNVDGKIQPFDWAIEPIEGGRRDGQYLYEIAGHAGLYSGERVREMMAKGLAEFANVAPPPPKPVHQH
jgi:NADH-quinone oxidoreductase subunit G